MKKYLISALLLITSLPAWGSFNESSNISVKTSSVYQTSLDNAELKKISNQLKDALSPFPISERKNIFQVVHSLFEDVINHANYTTVLWAIKEIVENTSSFSEIESIARFSQKVLKKTPQFLIRSLLFKKIKNILHDETDRERMIASTQPFFPDEMEVMDYIEIIEKIESIPAGEKENVLSFGQLLLPTKKEVYGYLQAISAVKEIPSEDRKSVATLTKLICANNMDSFSIGTTTEAIKNIVKTIPLAKDKEDFTHFCSSFLALTKNRDYFDGTEIAKIIKDLPSEERENFLVSVGSLFNDTQKTLPLYDGVILVKNIPDKDRKSLIALSKLLFTDTMRFHEGNLILETMKNILDKDRKEFVDFFLSFFTDNMDNYKRVGLIQKIAKLSVPLAQSILPPDMDKKHHTNILIALSSASLENIQNVAVLAKPCFKQDVSLLDYERMVEEIESVIKHFSLEKMETILRFSHLLFPNQMKSNHIIYHNDLEAILKTIEDLPSEEMQTVATLAHSIFPAILNDREGRLIIRGIKNIHPATEREHVVTLAKSLFTNNMNSHDRLRIIDAIKLIQSPQREARVRSAQERLQAAQQQGLITERNIFMYTCIFLEDPTYLVRVNNNAEIVGQEALMAQRETLRTLYENLVTQPATSTIIAENLPALGTENVVMAPQVAQLKNIIELSLKNALKDKMTVSEQMRLTNALMALALIGDIQDFDMIDTLRNIPASKALIDSLIGKDNIVIPRHRSSSVGSYKRYSLPQLPNIRQFFVLVYNLLNKQGVGDTLNPEQFTRNWLAEKFNNDAKAWEKFRQDFKPGFEEEMNFETVGEFLAQEKSSLIQHLVQVIEGTTDFIGHKSQHVYMKKLATEYAQINKEKFTPLIEALAMVMRGHNNNLDNPAEANEAACAEGAYIGIIKILQEIKDMEEIAGNALQALDIIMCGDPAAANLRRPAQPAAEAITLDDAAANLSIK